MYYFNAINPKDGKEWSIIHLVQYDEVVDRKSKNICPSAMHHAECIMARLKGGTLQKDPGMVRKRFL